MTPFERKRIEHRIAVAYRRLERGIDLRVEKLRGAVSEREIVATLEAKLKLA